MTSLGDYVVTTSGVMVWKTPEAHPLLKHTDTAHPEFLSKVAESFPKGKQKGLPKLCSENSEDACTWHYWSPLLHDEAKKTLMLTRLLREAFAGEVHSQVFEGVPSAKVRFWPKLNPPPSRPQREGASEPDVMITVGRQAVVLVEAKYRSPVSECTTYDAERDQVIRLLDVGSWYSKQQNCDRSYVIVLQYSEHQTNAEEVVGRYASRPESIRRALSYRRDLTMADCRQLSRSVAFVRWPDPFDMRKVLES